MNHPKIVFLFGCLVELMLSAPILNASPRGDGYGGTQYGGDYGNGNGNGQYGQATHSRVAELQRRLARAGYYHGSVDGVLGPQTRRAIRAYERDHGYASN